MDKTRVEAENFSAFSPAMMWEKKNRGLLLQLLIADLLALFRALQCGAPVQEIFSGEKRFFPYDWSYTYGHLNKVMEHIFVLQYVFDELSVEGGALKKLLHKSVAMLQKKKVFRYRLKKMLPQFFSLLEPFVEACKENENLLFFLLKNKQELDACMQQAYVNDLLLRLYPMGLEQLCEKLCDNYHHRGFYFLIPEIKTLISELL